MLPNLAVGSSLVSSNSGAVGTNNPGTSVPDGGSVNTYGTVTELISAANNKGGYALEVMVVNTLNPSALVTEMCLDILIGGATDSVLVASLLTGGSYYGNPRTWRFPIHIPPGVRIAAQISAGAAQTSEPRVVAHIINGMEPPPFPTVTKIDTLGTKANSSRGVALTAPGASGAARTITEIVASTSRPYKWLLPMVQVETDSTITNATMLNVGLGIGASTEEILGTWWFSKNASEIQGGPFPSEGVWGHFPSGSRLTLHVSNGNANDTAHGGLILAGY